MTLFGLVWALGIVVDDAIVVLENIERRVAMGTPVREATIDAMNEITGPILAITLVLSSVLLPSAFLSGITGQFFRQFALTISVSMLISAINAMTMTPARAAWIFGHRKPQEHNEESKEALPWWFFALIGGLISLWLLTRIFFNAPAAEEGEAVPGGIKAMLLTWLLDVGLFLPGAIIGGALGWLTVRRVNWALGKFFGGFNRLFERATSAYRQTRGSTLRPHALPPLPHLGPVHLT